MNSSPFFQSGRRKQRNSERKQLKLQKYYKKYFNLSRPRSVRVIEPEEDTQAGIPSLILSCTTTNENTIRDVISMPTASSLPPTENTDRQMSTLFSPASDYQQLVDSPSIIQETARKEASYPQMDVKRKPEEHECTSEPVYFPNVTMRKQKKMNRLEQLEQEVANLKELVEEQARRLMAARAEIDQLSVEYKKQGKSEENKEETKTATVIERAAKFCNKTQMTNREDETKKNSTY